MNTLVMKFGGASVASPQHFSHIADIIMQRHKSHPRLVVVVSAMGDTTDRLIDLAKQINQNPPKREYDMLVSVGERISISLLAMALAARNHQAFSFTGSQSGIITCCRHSEARIIDVRPHRLEKVMDSGSIAIVAGFQGVSYQGDITTLGRGGSDTSAVALAIAIKASKVEFFKDVEGIFAEDPKLNPNTHLLPKLSYEQALQVVCKGSKILHSRSVDLASKNAMPLHVRSFYNFDPMTESGTLIVGEGISPFQPLYEGSFHE